MNKALIILAFLSMTFMLLAVPLAICQTTKLYIHPSPVEKYPTDVCTTFDVDAKLETVIDLYGFDLNITWDGSMLTLVKVMYTSQMNDMWGSGNWTASINQTGTGYYKLVVTALSPAIGYSGTHVLVTLRFHVDSCPTGQTSIHFDTHKLSDSGANPISHTVTDGTYKMLSAPAPPVGGTWIPIDKLALLAPWIALALIAMSALGAGVYFKHRKGNQ